jgi:hypothetical protein
MAPEMNVGPVNMPQHTASLAPVAEADPQIPVALMCSTTSPLPGLGIGFLMSLTS